MDGNFNNEQNDYIEEGFTEASDQKKFDEVAPEHLAQNVGSAKLSLELGLIGFFSCLACIFFYVFLQRLMYIMVLTPVMPVAGIVSGISALKNDRGLPKAYIGIILSILTIIPSLICVFLFVWDLFLYRLVV
ncbi:MAG: hypothetical protein J5521_09490 [Lachnospiraceae bacterium]|nr:hypothetical protein [Lachnospiraceae bacterium]